MAMSLVRFGLRHVVANLERSAVVISATSVPNQVKLLFVPPNTGEEQAGEPNLSNALNETSSVIGAACTCFEQPLTMEQSTSLSSSLFLPRLIHTKPACVGGVCYLQERELLDLVRSYSKQHGRPERDHRKQSDSDSDSGSDTECKGYDRSEFWRRKMRTVHNILDVDKDGLISFNDFLLFAERFKSLGHLDERQTREFTEIIKLTWEEQWGAIDPYNFVTVEQYLEDMHHVHNDKALKKKAHRWLPYLFQAVDKDKSGFISVNEFKLFYQCLGLDNEHAAVAFAVIDTNGDGKLSQKEFVKLGKDFFFTEDETKVSKMFWGPLIQI